MRYGVGSGVCERQAGRGGEERIWGLIEEGFCFAALDSGPFLSPKSW